MKKKIFSILLSLAMVVNVVPAMTMTAFADSHAHSFDENGLCECGACDGNHTSWIEVDDETDFADITAENDANVVLTDDVDVTDTWTISGGTINFCLNGHVLKMTTADAEIIKVTNGATFNLYDCGTTQHKFSVNEDTGLWTLDEDNGTKTLTGGCITGSKIENKGEYGEAICCEKADINMYSGNIVGIDTQIPLEIAEEEPGGAPIVLYDQDSTFEMLGGKICGNYSAIAGGLYGYMSSNDIVIKGGEISDNVALVGAGAVCSVISDVVLEEGIINNNIGGMCGGIFSFADVKMYGGIVSNNKALGTEAAMCGGLMSISTDVYIYGGIISGNSGLAAGGILAYASGGEDYGKVILSADSTIIIAENSGEAGGILTCGKEIVLSADSDNEIIITGNSGKSVGAMLAPAYKLSGKITIKDNSSENDINNFAPCVIDGDTPAANVEITGSLLGSNIYYTPIDGNTGKPTFGIITKNYSSKSGSEKLDTIFHYEGPDDYYEMLVTEEDDADYAGEIAVIPLSRENKKKVSIDESITHGTVFSDKKGAKKDEVVTLMVSAEPNYECKSIRVQTYSGTNIQVRKRGEATYRFEMPDEAVIVFADFDNSKYIEEKIKELEEEIAKNQGGSGGGSGSGSDPQAIAELKKEMSELMVKTDEINVKSVMADSGEVNLSWNKIGVADGYEVYGDNKLLGTSTTNSFTASICSNYKVRAYIICDKEKIYANYSELSKPELSKNSIKSLKAKKNKLIVKYNKIPGAQTYEIKYKQGSGKWKTVTAKSLTKTIKKLKSKKRYSVKVRGVYAAGSVGAVSPWSATKTVKVK